jgi:hypothetical protein
MRPQVAAGGRTVTVTFYLPSGVIIAEEDVPMVTEALTEYSRRREGRTSMLRGPEHAQARAELRVQARRAARLVQTITTASRGQS